MAKPAKHPGKLDQRQSAFCSHFLVLNNATQAAIKAGYATKGAKQIGDRILGYPNVQIEIP